LTLEEATKAQIGSRCTYIHIHSLTSALNVFGWSTPRPGRFAPRERPGNHYIGDWVGVRVVLNGCGKSRPRRDSIPGSSSP